MFKTVASFCMKPPPELSFEDQQARLLEILHLHSDKPATQVARMLRDEGLGMDVLVSLWPTLIPISNFITQLKLCLLSPGHAQTTRLSSSGQ